MFAGCESAYEAYLGPRAVETRARNKHDDRVAARGRTGTGTAGGPAQCTLLPNRGSTLGLKFIAASLQRTAERH